MARIATKRLQKELADLTSGGGCPVGCRILKADDLETWVFGVRVLGDETETVYAGEEFALRFKFSPRYPIESPEVTFLISDGWKPPIHPHVYTCGHICLNALSTGWSPVLNCASICLSIQSMLASCKRKELPPDDERYSRSAPSNPKLTRWVFHDDTV